MTTFYRRVGRRYEPVLEHDSELMDALPYGDHLISVRRGGESRRHRVDPAFAPMIAAGLYAMDAMVKSIHDNMSLREESIRLTPQQQKLMAELTASMNRQDLKWTRPSAFDAAQAGLRVLEEEANRLLRNPAVRKAYEDFLLVARLCEDHKEDEQ